MSRTVICGSLEKVLRQVNHAGWLINRGDRLIEGYFIVIVLQIFWDFDMRPLNRRWPGLIEV